jgi:hypothetical protein
MELMERIQSLLCQQGITSDLKDDHLTTRIFTGPIGSRLRLVEHSDWLRCAVLIPIFTPEYRRAAMAQALSKANWTLPAGCFEMDPNDGELRFRSSMPTLDGSLTDEQIRSLVLTAWNTAARYATALVEVAFTEIEPDVAVARAEASWQAEQEPVVH